MYFPPASDVEMIAWLAQQSDKKVTVSAVSNPTPYHFNRWVKLLQSGFIYGAYNNSVLEAAYKPIEKISIAPIPQPQDVGDLGFDSSIAARDNYLVSRHRKRITQSVEVVSSLTTNQGRGAEIKWKHLSFRSEHEVAIAIEFDKLEVMFFPNAAIRLSQYGKRLTREVDFLVCKDSHWGILEVDGNQHRNSIAEDRARDDAFNDYGVWFIRRYPASVCKEKPIYVANDFIKRLDAFYAHVKG